jgi:hypothetical protein
MSNFQAREQKIFHIMLDQFCLSSLLNFLFDIPKFLTIFFSDCNRDIMQNARRSVWEEMFVSITQAGCNLLLINSLVHVIHTSCGYLELFYAHCTHLITVRSVACNKLEVSGRKW